MLKLKKITKVYTDTGTNFEALKGIDLNFRKNEFVSILGPSGCGKTTTLNIIGGLDKYTDGDLVIAGISTKEFKDSDWDSYRNHKVGFVFQSYNLIPHQTVQANVELGLAIAGLSKEERTKLAQEALDRVGLKGSYKKKPGQLSGGQCQRVAIARALVNKPDILLADEPTGALDSVTSVQIMDLIKDISKDTLVIMVTHNGELAQKYSTRIVTLLDGELTGDTNPYDGNDTVITKEETSTKKSVLTWKTSFGLSIKNLLSKRKRTILTSFAGSIGIIGISTVLAFSNGIQGYVTNMQEDMLSGNPIVISETAYNMEFIMGSMTNQDMQDAIIGGTEDGIVYPDKTLENLIEQFNAMDEITLTNDITQTYIDYLEEMPKENGVTISYNYDFDFENNVFTTFDEEVRTIALNKYIYGDLIGEVNAEAEEYAQLVMDNSDVFNPLPQNNEYIFAQYNLVEGKMPSSSNELLIVIDENQTLSDITLAQLGYYGQDQFIDLINSVMNEEDNSTVKGKFTNEEIMNKKFYYGTNDEVFEKTGTYYNYNGATTNTDSLLEMEVVGILKPKSGITYGALEHGLYYTDSFSKLYLEDNLNSTITTEVASSENQLLMSTVNDMGGGIVVRTGVITNYSYTFEGVTTDVADLPFGNTDMTFFGQGLPYPVLTLRQLGGSSLPSEIKLFVSSFENQEQVVTYLDAWNEDKILTINGVEVPKDNRTDIVYTDTLSIMISMINELLNIVTIALIAFTSLALVVSCVMIAIITYISVVERVKEIGVIRSLGGRKKDVSRLFNVETFVIGLASGTFGVIITAIIALIVSIIVYVGFGIPSIAALKWSDAVIMISVSTLLTIISGFIPARNAAKQDPVRALRSE